MHKVKYGLFYDNHTQYENPDVGKDFNAEDFVREVKKCGVDYLTFHARCNVGMAYYKTKIGIRHPSLHYDLFGGIAKACQKEGIALSAYFNGGISTMEGIRHPDWMTRYLPENDRFGKNTPYAITMCYNSPYRDHLLSMIREVAQNYLVQGFFIDCMMPYPCVCPTCIRMMKEEGIDWRNDQRIRKFARESVRRLSADIVRTVNEYISEPMLYFNGPQPDTFRDLDTFFDCECLPTASWGYECLPAFAHDRRNIKHGTQILNMTGRFYEWGDFGGLRCAESLKFDLFYGLAHGMRPNIGGHFHPRGDRDQAIFDRIRDVYHELQQYDPLYENAENLTDTAILYPEINSTLYSDGPSRSAVRMLEELKIQFDIIPANCGKSLDSYKLVIIPENVEVTAPMEQMIRKHIAKGGAFFACGKNVAEKFSPELGIEYQGESGLDPVYFRMQEHYADGIDDMFLSLYAPASKAAVINAETVAWLVKPYYNAGWNGITPILYTPPQEETAMPFLTVRGKCVWCSGDLFTGYFKRGALHLRAIMKNVIFSLLEKPLLWNLTLPAFVRTAVAKQTGRINVHLIAYSPEARGECMVVEDAAIVADGAFRVLTSGHKIQFVTLALGNVPLDFTINEEYTEIHLPLFRGYALVSLKIAEGED